MDTITITKTILSQKQSKVGIYDVAIVSLPLHKNDITFPFNDSQLNTNTVDNLCKIITFSKNLIKEKGLLFIYGSPVQLIKAYENMSKEFIFRHWIALDMLNSFENHIKNHLKHNHIGILMFSKEKQFIPLDTKNARAAYIACNACGKNLKDWGGKKHLMNIKGTGISDVWRDLFKVQDAINDPQNPKIKLNVINVNSLSFTFDCENIPELVLNRLLNLVNAEKHKIVLIKTNKNIIKTLNNGTNIVNSKLNKPKSIQPDKISNQGVILGDCIKVMDNLSKKYPDGIFDLVFADPPYNLSKNYKIYDDELADQEYVEWCNRWIKLCVKLTKPTGSIFLLNIPKWALAHAVTLNKIAYLQNWIVWDALSTPKGKIMPAHYALLYYTKSPKVYTYNNDIKLDSPEYCLRSSCIKNRKNVTLPLIGLSGKLSSVQQNHTVPISDIWWDVFRIKHKKNRDNHPCQLPDKLMDRIINIFSNEGDMVFDPFAGAGTTAIRAKINKRLYTTIEIDPLYKGITEKKLQELQANGFVVRRSVKKQNGSIYTKKGLELKVMKFAQELGRKPSLEEFINQYSLNFAEIEKLYGDAKRVLKAGRISLLNHSYYTSSPQ